ncbi:MAG: thioredoxin-disulfide reductase [Candidatus Omnitrophota bacterium]|nr:thioredoxin-disulfide reductase [Candidatus Omnitrophota bacterium]
MFDLVIIGAGPAGLTAAIYAGRARLKTLVLEKLSPGGQVMLTDSLENYPGFPGGITTKELIERLVQQVEDLDIEIELNQIERIEKANGFRLNSQDNKEYQAKAVIIATGAQPKKLDCVGEDKLRGRGVSYCAICDAPLYKNKEILVVGGGDKAVEEALYLKRFAKSVKLIHRRDKLRATAVLQERILNHKSIEIIWKSVIKQIQGKERVESIIIQDVETKLERKISIEGVFVSVGVAPNTEFLKEIINLDELGYILTDETMRTSCLGIFACGDCRKRPLQQVITACSDGAVAAVACCKYLEEN